MSSYWQFHNCDSMANPNKFANRNHVPQQKPADRTFHNKPNKYNNTKKCTDKEKVFVHPSMVEDPWLHLMEKTPTLTDESNDSNKIT